MEKYYEILGLSKEATQGEIKKAYFKLVRKYSPEKYPEEFREIREAYEFLKNAEISGPVFPVPEDSRANLFLKQILEYEKKGNFILFRDACEEALRLFPKEIQFQYLLAVAQRKAGNTGKAIKTGEALIKEEPENKWYWRELALAYIERGFNKKAFPCIMKAFDMGCVDNDFLLISSLTCNELRKYEECATLLLVLVKKEKRWKREEIPEILEAYTGLFIMGVHTEEVFKEVLTLFLEFLRQYTMYLEENSESVFTIISSIYLFAIDRKEYDEALNEIVQIVQGACRSRESENLVSILLEEKMLCRLLEDERLSETVKVGAQTYFDKEMEHELHTFAVLDMKLCMLKEQSEILPQLAILEEEYSLFYEKIHEFAEKLKKNKNLYSIKNSMQRQYASLSQYVGGGRYFELYPEEKIRSFGKVIYESEDAQPYVRSGKKIGRNEPCPCGSGKKYKQCCMNKEK